MGKDFSARRTLTSRRSTNLRKINLTIGAILVVTGVAGGFLLTFWFLIMLLPITCVGASWMMASTVRPGQEAHVVGAILLSALFAVWLWYFLQNGAEMPTWYGIFLMWTLLMIQAAIYLSTKPDEARSADVDPAS